MNGLRKQLAESIDRRELGTGGSTTRPAAVPTNTKGSSMERRLTLSRKPHQKIVVYVAGERVEFEVRQRVTVTVTASDEVKIVRGELEQKEQAA